MAKFLIYSTYGEVADLAMRLQQEGHQVGLYISDPSYKKVMDGIVPKVDSWYRAIGKGVTWIFDGCENGDLQDWLREKGEAVFGGSSKGDELENNRQLNQEWFKSLGFPQPESYNFKTIDDALSFVQEHLDKMWVLKQNGDAPKSINHVGKFEDNADMIKHLEDLKQKWNVAEMGEFDCDLMEKVEGLEVAASVFFDGQHFVKNKEGKVVGYLNFEEKKECEGGMGETTGETGTLFYGCDEEHPIFKEIIMRDGIEKDLAKLGFRGVFDINGCLKDDGEYVAFEPTMRFGVPATSYEFVEGMKNDTGEFISNVARGEPFTLNLQKGWGMVIVVSAKPYPSDAEVEDGATSLGEYLWPLQDGKNVQEFTDEQWKHIHLYNFKEEEGCFEVATKCGYLLTVTGTGRTIKATREALNQYIKDNLYLPNMKFRTDIGKRVEDSLGGSNF